MIFSITLPRFRERDGLRHDRLLARWQLVRVTPTGHAPQSHARYAETLPCPFAESPTHRTRKQKGPRRLGCKPRL